MYMKNGAQIQQVADSPYLAPPIPKIPISDPTPQPVKKEWPKWLLPVLLALIAIIIGLIAWKLKK
jgi:hypothetical protein